MIQARRGLLIFATVHLLVWTIFPSLLYHNAPVDVIEGITWGRQWAWGYDKHPWLAPWLTELASLLGGHTAWPIYLLSQISVLICGFATWRLASAMLPIAHATLAVLLLEAIYYYHFPTPEFNPNVAMLPLWALTTLTFYRAIQTQNIHTWLLLGFYAGLAMMAKYFSAVLLGSAFVFLLIHPTARRSFRHAGPYLAALICLLVMLPNLIWVFEHHWASFQYAVTRPENPGTWYHIIRPIQFTLSQGIALAPALLAFIPCFSGEKCRLPITSFNRQFIIWFSTVPLALVLFISAGTSMRLRSIYGMPLFIFFGLFLMVLVQPQLTAEQIGKTIRNIIMAFALSVLALCVSTRLGPPLMTHESKHAIFPGKEIALWLTEQWHTRYHRPLAYVAGEHWLSGSVAFYSKDQPTAYFYWSPSISFWIDERQVEEKGAVFIWNARKYGEQLPAELQARFPRIETALVQSFPPAPVPALLNPVPPTLLGVAFLPPKNFTIFQK